MHTAVFIVAAVLMIFFRLVVFPLSGVDRDLLLLPNSSSALLLFDAYFLTDDCCARGNPFERTTTLHNGATLNPAQLE
jgi:hypothetical protein